MATFSARPTDPKLKAACDATIRVEGGSGVVISRSTPVIVTGHHVVRRASEGEITIAWPGSGGSRRTHILAVSEADDLAILSAPDGLPSGIELRSSQNLPIGLGETLWLCGFPDGWPADSPLVAPAVVAGVGHETWVNGDGTWGNSGGLLVTLHERPEVVGVVIGRAGSVRRDLDEARGHFRGAREHADEIVELGKQDAAETLTREIAARFSSKVVPNPLLIDEGDQLEIKKLLATVIGGAMGMFETVTDEVDAHFRTGFLRVVEADRIRQLLGD